MEGVFGTEIYGFEHLGHPEGGHRNPFAGPNALQLKNGRRVFESFAPPFEEFHYGYANFDLRMAINEFVFCIARDGSCRVEYPMGSPIRNLLDSDGPDYDPEAYAGLIDDSRKAERENR